MSNIDRIWCIRIRLLVACLMTTILLQLFFPSYGLVHPPQDVQISYDQVRRLLEVRIAHSSKDPSAHYVKKVEIRKADKIVSSVEYQSQPGQPAFAYDYPLDVGAGDVVEVKVSCSIFGSKTVKMDAGK